MKRKSISKKIDAFIKKFKTIQKNGVKEQGKETLATLKVMESDINTAVRLQQEIKKLKDTLKSRKNELEKKVKSFKYLKKGLKKARKSDARDEMIIKSQPATRTVRKKKSDTALLDSEVGNSGSGADARIEASPKTRVVRKKAAGRPKTGAKPTVNKTGTSGRRALKPKTPLISQN